MDPGQLGGCRSAVAMQWWSYEDSEHPRIDVGLRPYSIMNQASLATYSAIKMSTEDTWIPILRMNCPGRESSETQGN